MSGVPIAAAYRVLLERLRELDTASNSMLAKIAFEVGLVKAPLAVNVMPLIKRLLNAGVLERVGFGVYRVDKEVINAYLRHGAWLVSCVPINAEFLDSVSYAATALGAPENVAERARNFRWLLDLAGDRLCDVLNLIKYSRFTTKKRKELIASLAVLLLKQHGIHVPAARAAEVLGAHAGQTRHILFLLEKAMRRALRTPLEEAVRQVMESIGATHLLGEALQLARRLRARKAHNGSSPWVLASAIAALVCQRNSCKTTLKEISRAAGVTIVATRLAIRRLNDLI